MMATTLRFVENKVTGFSEEPSEGIVQMVFNVKGVCLMCGHTPGNTNRGRGTGHCCPCGSCICCAQREGD